MNPALARLDAGDAVQLVIDAQDRLLPAMHEADALEAALLKLTGAMRILSVPAIVTEHYPAGLGAMRPSVRQSCADATVIEKIRFSACIPALMTRLTALNRRQVIVCGVEAHVCVQQTVLDLLRHGYTVAVCADATTSRRPLDRDIALDRMRQAGALVTTAESVIYELLVEAGTDRFRQVLKLVK